MSFYFNPFSENLDYYKSPDISGFTTDDLLEGSTNLYYTDARSRQSISETITGLDYDNTTGVFSLSSGYVIPTTTEESNWNTAYGWGDHAAAGYLTSISGLDHGDLDATSRLDDDHTQYLLLAGRSGQTINDDIIINGYAKAESFNLDTLYSETGSEPVGSIFWNQDEETANLKTTSNITLQIGQETFVSAKNQTGSVIGDGVPVMFAGTLGASGKVLIQPAIADGSLFPHYTVGITTESIANGENGKVTWFGKVRGINTTGTPYGEVWSDGDVIYISPTSAGSLTNVKPLAPNRVIIVAAVIKSHSNGTLLVRPTWHSTLHDLDDVNITATDTSGQIIVWDNDNKYFDFTENINNYFYKPGRLGGQIAYGGTGAADDLYLRSTSNATKGTIYFGSDSVYKEDTMRWGFGTGSPAATVHVVSPVGAGYNGIQRWEASGSSTYSLVLNNASGNDAAFSPAFSATTTGTLGLGFYSNIVASADTTANSALTFDGRRYSGGALTNRSIVRFQNYGTSVMEILATGHINIANNFFSDISQLAVIPTAADVKGQVIRGYASQSSNLLEFQDSSALILSYFDENGGLVVNHQEEDVDTRIGALNTTNALFIQGSDGKVGVGCVPSYLLDTRSSNLPYIRVTSTANASTGFRIKRDETAGSYNDEWVWYMPADSTDLRLYNGSDLLTITSAGYVYIAGNLGIGTNTPTAQLHTTKGRIVGTSRYTTTQTLDADDHVVFCNTDGGSWTLSLPAGVEGTHYKIINCGSSGNDLTVDPNGTEQLYKGGAGVSLDLIDGEVINIHFSEIEGWH